MFHIFNRLSWVISICCGIGITYFFNNTFLPFFDSGERFFLFLLGIVVFSSLFKYNVFGEKFIAMNLNGYAVQYREKSHQSVSAQACPSTDESENNIPKKVKIESKNKNIQKMTKIFEEKKEIVQEERLSEPSKVGGYIKEFFQENLLAKIGAILVFLGVVFLMSLIWNQIHAVGKIMIGFSIGFLSFFGGVFLDKKGYAGESRILMGAGILINYFVILSGRYLVGDTYGVNMGILSVGVTFLFLILNTCFAILVAIFYKSNVLLFFGFVCAYLNPLLIGEHGQTPYMLLLYAFVVSAGCLFIGFRQKKDMLQYLVLILGNMLFIIAPFSDEWGWVMKILATAILGMCVLFFLYKNKCKSLLNVFILNYICIILQLFVAGNSGILGEGISFVIYMSAILVFFIGGLFLFFLKAFSSIIWIFLFPILILLGLLSSGTLAFIIPSLVILVLVYCVGFFCIETVLTTGVKYLFFLFLGGYILMMNVAFKGLPLGSISMSVLGVGIVCIVSLLFLWISYFFSTKKELESLYSLGTVARIFNMLPMIFQGNEQGGWVEGIVIVTTCIFAFSNMLFPFFNHNLRASSKGFRNFLIGIIIGALFIGSQLFVYGNKYFPGIMLGIAFIVLTGVYILLSIGWVKRLGMLDIHKTGLLKNTVFVYLSIALSFLSLSVVFLFSRQPEIISMIWFLETTILYYFFGRMKENIIGCFATILFVIGEFKLKALSVAIQPGDFIYLIPLGVVAISLLLNIKFLQSVLTEKLRVLHDGIHILAVCIVGVLMLKIIPISFAGYGIDMLCVSGLFLFFSFCYAFFPSKVLKLYFIISMGFFMIFHVLGIYNIFTNIDIDHVAYMRWFQYLITFMIAGIMMIWHYFNKNGILNSILKLMYIIYIGIIGSYYFYDIFQSTFVITLFLGCISFAFLLSGIFANKVTFRTVGLYTLSILLGKIFLYDVWYGFDNAIARVIAFIILGIVLILISVLYSKKYSTNLKGEWKVNNLLL